MAVLFGSSYNLTFPESSAPEVETEESMVGVYKELALLAWLELLLRNNSRNSRGRQVFGILVCFVMRNGGGSI